MSKKFGVRAAFSRSRYLTVVMALCVCVTLWACTSAAGTISGWERASRGCESFLQLSRETWFSGVVSRQTNVTSQLVALSAGMVLPLIAESQPILPLPEPQAPPPGAAPWQELRPPASTGAGGNAGPSPMGGPSFSNPMAPAASATAAEATGEVVAAVPQGEANQRPSGGSSFWHLVKAGGTVGAIIILLSVVTVAIAVEHFLSLRRELFIPPSLVETASQKIAMRDWKGVQEACQSHPSPLGRVVAAGVAEWEVGWSEMEKVMEDALAEETARWIRKVDYLSVIGNIAPMLGLLGTVMGMILAFRTVAETQGAARAADLAQAIYMALVTTVEGLVVAIPALAAYAYFRNRVDELMAEVAGTVQRLFAPLKRRRAAGKVPTSAPVGGRSE